MRCSIQSANFDARVKISVKIRTSSDKGGVQLVSLPLNYLFSFGIFAEPIQYAMFGYFHNYIKLKLCKGCLIGLRINFRN